MSVLLLCRGGEGAVLMGRKQCSQVNLEDTVSAGMGWFRLWVPCLWSGGFGQDEALQS